ncbi:MAG: DUF6798 domain-containing protein [Bacteroidota bacterium]
MEAVDQHSAAMKTIRNKAPYIVLLVLGYGLYLLRFGYGYGTSDQDEFIPFLYSLLNPAYFQNDWFVQTQLSAFSVRTYFVYLLYGLSIAMPVWLAVFVVYVASWASIASAVYQLADGLLKNRLSALISAGLVCIFTPFWTLGGNDLLHFVLVPSMTAWALALWAFVFYLRKDYTRAGLFAGIATLFQALVGLQVMLLVGGMLCLQFFQPHMAQGRRHHFMRVLTTTAVYAIVAAFALVPLFYQQFSAVSETLSDTISETISPTSSLFYIMAQFRNPHHYLFSAFDKVRLIKFFVVLLVGYLVLLAREKQEGSVRAGFFNDMLVLVTGVCLVAYVGTEIMQQLTIAKLQLFKMTLLVKALMVMLIADATVRVLPTRWANRLDQLCFNQPLRLAALFAVGFAGILIMQPDRLQQKVYPWRASGDPEIQLARWAAKNTLPAEVFAVPPSWSAFRSHARRAIVINHKAFPYQDTNIRTWFDRLQDMAPLQLPEQTDPTLLAALDFKYNTLTPHDLEELGITYSFDYIIRNAPLPAASSYSVEYETQGWFVYKLSAQRLALQ